MASVLASRVAIVLMLTAQVAVGPGFAPEHVHERDEHHPSATVHRHLTPHHAQHSQDGAKLDDDDDERPVVWLTTAFLQTAVYHVPSLTATPATITVAPALAERWTALVLDDGAPPHGPPRAPRSLRAPPRPA
jgi:hypothetical protein